jgi:hypothetical protein
VFVTEPDLVIPVVLLFSALSVFNHDDVVTFDPQLEVNGIVTVKVDLDYGSAIIVGPIVVIGQPRLIHIERVGVIVQVIFDTILEGSLCFADFPMTRPRANPYPVIAIEIIDLIN